jgi:hypothetical protein
MFSKKLIGVIGAAALVTMLVAGPASAAPADLTVTAGTLDFDVAPTISAFNAVTLNGTPQLTSLTIDPFRVTNATGDLAGWHVMLTIPDLDNGTDTIASTNLAMAAPIVSAVVPSAMAGVSAAAGGATLDAGTKIVVATATNGGGIYQVSPLPVFLTVPQDAAAGAYTSAATITVNTGP